MSDPLGAPHGSSAPAVRSHLGAQSSRGGGQGPQPGRGTGAHGGKSPRGAAPQAAHCPAGRTIVRERVALGEGLLQERELAPGTLLPSILKISAITALRPLYPL